jgi:hypothetical protein
MNDPVAVDETAPQSDQVQDTYVPPFLKITGRYPDGDNYRTVELEINLREDDAVGDYDPANAGDATAAKSWMVTLCTEVIASLRCPPPPPAVVLSSAAVQKILRHAETCAGTCGGQLPLLGRDPVGVHLLGHEGSDRWTGGDRKDDH